MLSSSGLLAVDINRKLSTDFVWAPCYFTSTLKIKLKEVVHFLHIRSTQTTIKWPLVLPPPQTPRSDFPLQELNEYECSRGFMEFIINFMINFKAQ